MKDTVKGKTPDPTAPSGVPTNEQLADCQYADHFVLSEEDRQKGYVRPYRDRYKHAGMRPKHPTRELTADEKERYADMYALFEVYPKVCNAVGRFWTQIELDSGCGAETIMPEACAETYATEPNFYGSTFCCHCGDYFPVKQFVWVDDGTVVGS